MEAAPIPFAEGQMSGYDELSGTQPSIINFMIEGPSKVLRARPGVRAWSEFPSTFPSDSPVVAMFAFAGEKLIYITEDRKVYAWQLGSVIDISLGPDTTIAGSQEPSFTVGRSVAIVCGGAEPQQITSGLSSSRLAGSPDTPPRAYDAAFIAQRTVLVEADDKGLWFWSGLGEPGVNEWDTVLDFAEAEARPDALVGCKETSRELWMFGTSTVQIFVPDETTVFTPGPTLEIGCSSKRSIIRIDQTMAWADNRNRLVMSTGRDLTVLSDQGIAETLESLTFDDVWGTRIKIGNHDFLVWTFPTDGRAFAYDMLTSAWAEWRGWDDRWIAWPAYSHFYWEEKDIHLVGLKNGQVAELSLSAYSDLDLPLRWLTRSGFQSATKRKHCIEAQFLVRRGEATSADSAIEIRWRDELGPAIRPIRRTLGTPGKAEPLIRVSPCGMPYRQRQWELSGAANDAIAIAGAKELFEESEV